MMNVKRVAGQIVAVFFYLLFFLRLFSICYQLRQAAYDIFSFPLSRGKGQGVVTSGPLTASSPK